MITMVVAAYHRFQPAPSFHLASTSCLPIFSFLSALSFQKPPTIPPLSSEPADDRLTFGLMALAGSRRWWMTVGERQTFGAIRRFKRFFVTGARYVAAPAWPATMRQKQCWLIAFQNCERWKTVSRPPMVAATVFENGVRCSTFSFATRERGGEGFEAGRRFDSRKSSQLNQVAAITRLSIGLFKMFIKRPRWWHARVFASMIRPLFSRNLFRFEERISPLYFICRFRDLFFVLFSFFFRVVSGTRRNVEKRELPFLLLFIGWINQSVE